MTMTTSSSSPNPISVTTPNAPTFIEIIEAPKKIRNNFDVSADGRQASRKYKILTPTEKELIFTVFFPENATDSDRDKLLENLSEKNLKVLGECAIALGLTGKASRKGKITSISFNRDDKGNIYSFSKMRNKDKSRDIDVKYYEDKKKAATDDAKGKRFQVKKEKFQELQNFWNNNLNKAQKA
jgi:hypothetical protein